MKTVTENNQVYVVSDTYPAKPYVKYVQARGCGDVIDDPIADIKAQIKSLSDKIDALDSKLSAAQKAGA